MFVSPGVRIRRRSREIWSTILFPGFLTDFLISKNNLAVHHLYWGNVSMSVKSSNGGKMKKSPLESSIATACESLTQACETYSKQCEENIRRSPLPSVLFAAAFGYLLQFLPVRRIMSGVIRVFLSLIQPAVLIFGAARLVSLLAQNGEAVSVKDKKPKK